MDAGRASTTAADLPSMPRDTLPPTPLRGALASASAASWRGHGKAVSDGGQQGEGGWGGQARATPTGGWLGAGRWRGARRMALLTMRWVEEDRSGLVGSSTFARLVTPTPSATVASVPAP